MTDIAVQFNSVAWEVGRGSPIEDPFIFGVVVTTRGRAVQLGSMRMSDLNGQLLRILRKGPPKPPSSERETQPLQERAGAASDADHEAPGRISAPTTPTPRTA